ncbi:MAG: Flp pilus assembly protein CpaB [Lentisphaeria bacterium]|jgi:pilus assembly protein CpaB|nr:Flp pilus assembly protein CpaB [Lentisphaeria bacterium]MBQ8756577.1 Flp pilus assembly protein CpaB [Lentisphaeria bacterium]MBQ9777170.1 Flp pilus assembly protein CpaB [Lentisphaeria bacterium]
MRQRFLLLGAVFFGVLAFLLTYTQIDKEKRRLMGTSETVSLIQVRRNMVEGEELKETDLRRIEVKRQRDTSSLSREIPWRDLSRIVGRKLDTTVVAGQILLTTDLKPLSRRQGFTGIIQEGGRAVAIAVDSVSAVNHLIQPNDNVDIIGTFRFPDAQQDSSLDTVTMTILQNVKVLAVGNQWREFRSEEGSVHRSYNTVTLQLWPAEVEMIVFASQKGRLSLSLRNYEDSSLDRDLEKRSVNFKLLEKEIPKYNKQREERRRLN